MRLVLSRPDRPPPLVQHGQLRHRGQGPPLPRSPPARGVGESARRQVGELTVEESRSRGVEKRRPHRIVILSEVDGSRRSSRQRTRCLDRLGMTVKRRLLFSTPRLLASSTRHTRRLAVSPSFVYARSSTTTGTRRVVCF